MTQSRATGDTPFFLVFEAKAMLPSELKIKSPRVSLFADTTEIQHREDDLDVLEEKCDLASARATKY